jgi:hypothetical protein
MKAVLVLVASISISASAAPRVCSELESAYSSDQITELEFICGGNAACEKLKLDQLRAGIETLIFEEPRPDLSDSDLVTYFQPTYTKISFGSEVFDGIKTTFMGQPFVTYLEEGSTNVANFYIDSETIKADGDVCYDVEFSPVLSVARKESACGLMVAEVNRQRPGTNLDVSDCTYYITDFLITAKSRTEAVLKVDGKIDNFTTYACSVDVERATDALSNLACKIIDSFP